MLSSLTAEYDFTNEVLTEVVEDTYDIKPNDIAKVYIPVYMPNIEPGEPEILPLEINGYSIYKNDGGCMPSLTGPILHEKNYLEAKMQNNSDIKVIGAVDEAEIEYIPEGAVVRSTFLNGKMKDLFYNTDSDHKR